MTLFFQNLSVLSSSLSEIPFSLGEGLEVRDAPIPVLRRGGPPTGVPFRSVPALGAPSLGAPIPAGQEKRS